MITHDHQQAGTSTDQGEAEVICKFEDRGVFSARLQPNSPKTQVGGVTKNAVGHLGRCDDAEAIRQLRNGDQVRKGRDSFDLPCMRIDWRNFAVVLRQAADHLVAVFVRIPRSAGDREVFAGDEVLNSCLSVQGGSRVCRDRWNRNDED